jgi:hypothetical protein
MRTPERSLFNEHRYAQAGTDITRLCDIVSKNGNPVNMRLRFGYGGREFSPAPAESARQGSAWVMAS